MSDGLEVRVQTEPTPLGEHQDLSVCGILGSMTRDVWIKDRASPRFLWSLHTAAKGMEQEGHATGLISRAYVWFPLRKGEGGQPPEQVRAVFKRLLRAPDAPVGDWGARLRTSELRSSPQRA